MEEIYLLDKSPELVFSLNFQTFWENSNFSNMLDKYLKKNFCKFAERNDRENLIIISKIANKALRYSDLPKDLNIKWSYLIELTSVYLESKSTVSAYKQLKAMDKYSFLIIKLLDSINDYPKVTELADLFETSKQQMSKIINKMEKIGVIRKDYESKNVFISITSLGQELNKEYLEHINIKLYVNKFYNSLASIPEALTTATITDQENQTLKKLSRKKNLREKELVKN